MRVALLAMVLLVATGCTGAFACPGCSAAEPTVGSGTDPALQSRAINLSILFMLVVVYTVPLVVGLVIYRAYRPRRVRGLVVAPAGPGSSPSSDTAPLAGALISALREEHSS